MHRSKRDPLVTLALTAVIVAGLLAILAAIAHADPVAGLAPATDTAWTVFATSGPYWGAILVAYLLLQTFLARQHWLAQGRLLAALSGASMVLTAVVQWHWSGAPSAGVLTAAMAAFTLVLHPVPVAVRAPSRGSGGLAMLAVLLIGVAGAGSLTSCAGSQRADTIKAALVTVDGARDGFLAYDRAHEQQLVAEAVSADDARAKLAAYQAKRARVDPMFGAAYRGIAAAELLNDDPSLAGMQAAIANLIGALKPFLGGK